MVDVKIALNRNVKCVKKFKWLIIMISREWLIHSTFEYSLVYFEKERFLVHQHFDHIVRKCFFISNWENFAAIDVSSIKFKCIVNEEKSHGICK